MPATAAAGKLPTVAPSAQELQAEVRRLRAQLQSVTNQRDIYDLVAPLNKSARARTGSAVFSGNVRLRSTTFLARGAARRKNLSGSGTTPGR